VHIVGAVFEMSAMPLRATTAKLSQAIGTREHAPGASESDGNPTQVSE